MKEPPNYSTLIISRIQSSTLSVRILLSSQRPPQRDAAQIPHNGSKRPSTRTLQIVSWLRHFHRPRTAWRRPRFVLGQKRAPLAKGAEERRRWTASNKGIATNNKCIATSSQKLLVTKGIATSRKKLLVTRASLLFNKKKTSL